MNIYVINNYGLEKSGQDCTIGYADCRDAANKLIEKHWNHLTPSEQNRVGGEYAVSAYEVPAELQNQGLSLDAISATMILEMGLMESDSEIIDSYVITKE